MTHGSQATGRLSPTPSAQGDAVTERMGLDRLNDEWDLENQDRTELLRALPAGGPA